jgi:GT2 family glycosyltransferase
MNIDTLRPLIYILVVNWNNWKDTSDCLASLRRLDYSHYRVLLLDNGSTDGSVPRIRESFPEVEIAELGANLGFAKGNNVGMRIALGRGADFVWLLNNDTTVDPMALGALLRTADCDRRAGAVGSVIYSFEDPEQIRIWGGGHIDFLLGRSICFPQHVVNENVQYITGASLFLRRQAVEQVGLLDEEFFMYWEDADYGFRLRRSGWRLAVAADSKVWHKEQGSVGKKSVLMDAYFNRSAVRFFRKHASLPLVPVGFSLTQRFARWVLMGDLARVGAVWTAVRQPETISVRSL